MNPETKDTAPNPVGAGAPSGRAAGLVVVLFILLALGGYGGAHYLEHYSGGFNAKVYEPFPNHAFLVKYPPLGEGGGPVAKGKRVYETYCQVCHQPSGLGLPGQFPPLAGSEWVVAKKSDRIIRIVLNGLAGPVEVKGQQFNAAMVPFGPVLGDEDIANVLSYIRATWGNSADPVKTEEVKAIRAEAQSRALPWSAQELLQIPVE